MGQLNSVTAQSGSSVATEQHACKGALNHGPSLAEQLCSSLLFRVSAPAREMLSSIFGGKGKCDP